MDVPGIPRAVLGAMIAVALLVFAGGAAWALSWVTHHTDTHTRILPAGSAIDVASRNSDVEVVGTDRSDVRLVSKERRSVFGRPHVHVGYTDGRLRLDNNCSGVHLFGDDCMARFVLEVPHGMAVRLVASSADVHAIDVSGRLSVHVSSGDVHVDAPSPDIVAETSSGDIHVRASDATNVKAEATSGDVHVSVPDRTYAVLTRSDSGDRHLDVREDPRSPRHLDAETTSGDVHVDRDGR
jgi:Putative adhesin